VQIPHGPYPAPVPETHPPAEQLKSDWEIPAGAFLLLSFGHIRDGKNLQLLLEALQQHPSAYLLVAGRQQSSGQRTIRDYQAMAAQLGVAERCRWVEAYIPEEEIWKYFTACDAVALTYSSDFRSASGVLNVNAQFRKPVLASCGPGPLKTAVESYQLGPWVEPDSSEAIEQGLEQLLKNANWAQAKWDAYLKDHSWEENAKRVIEAFESYKITDI
jgi:glycosyltransferase involved in cell wall biosynthesis